MNYAEMHVIKRDGKREDFSINKIKNAINKAFAATGIEDEQRLIAEITMDVVSQFTSPDMTVEEIQDLVEKELMKARPEVAKKYIIYREWRNTERDKKTRMKRVMDGIVAIDRNDVNLSNANMSSHTPAGQMMTFASEVTKDYTYKYLLPKRFAEAHLLGDIHIHDLDYYPTKTTTCIQYDLDDLFERGFRTKNGSIRTPQSIQSYATLATIVFQTNQNEQHGGQAIPAFDFFMAKGVAKSFRKHTAALICFHMEMETGERMDEKAIRTLVEEHLSSIKPSETERETLRIALMALRIRLDKERLGRIVEKAYQQTQKDTHQAMEGFIHNLNTMHSRGGNQVVFSSINYGTDTSAEGRMVMEELLKATMEGLGKQGEVPVFPIQIFKVKDGVSFSEKDYEKAMKVKSVEAAMREQYEAPNFDLLLKACQTTAKALFPNFMFLDAPFNRNEKWNANDPKRYVYELATMGCRTRVYENVNGEKSSLGRGNLSFTTLNMPRLAIEARIKAESLAGTEGKAVEQKAKELFLESVHEMAVLVADQLYERYRYQRTALARQFPFMMGNNVWKGGGALEPNEQMGDVLRSGTLGFGFIGGHNAMVALYGEGHGHCQRAWDTLYEAVMEMNKVADEYKAKYGLNYSVLATPAEGLSGRFTKMDRKKYGEIKGVTDREYYVNSFHVDVKEPIGIVEKIRREAPFHAITRGGHITYVELDGEAQKNVRAIVKIVKVMHDEGIGYGSINHPVDTCEECGYKGVILDKCPVCQSEHILRMRRITGYLTGNLSSWNSAKRAEERDRVKHR